MCAIHVSRLSLSLSLYIYTYMEKSHTHIYIYIVQTPAILICIRRTLVYGNWWKLLKTRGKRWDLPKLAIPLFKVMSSYFSNIHISDTQISHIIHSSSHIYIYINAAVSCKRYPPSLPYIIIVQTCGKRWDLSKFVDVLSVSFHNRSYIEVLAQFHPGIACPPRSQSGTTIQGEDCWANISLSGHQLFSGEHAYLWAFKLWTPRRHGFCASYQFFIMNYHHPSTTVILCLSAFLWTSGEWVLRGICVGAFPVEQVWLFSRFGFSSIFDQPLGHIKDPTWFSSIYRGGMETCGTITGVVIRRWRC